jgi:hypothetical protein
VIRLENIITAQNEVISLHQRVESLHERKIASDKIQLGAAQETIAKQVREVEEKDCEIKRLKQMLADKGIDFDVAYVDMSLCVRSSY